MSTGAGAEKVGGPQISANSATSRCAIASPFPRTANQLPARAEHRRPGESRAAAYGATREGPGVEEDVAFGLPSRRGEHRDRRAHRLRHRLPRPGPGHPPGWPSARRRRAAARPRAAPARPAARLGTGGRQGPATVLGVDVSHQRRARTADEIVDLRAATTRGCAPDGRLATRARSGTARGVPEPGGRATRSHYAPPLASGDRRRPRWPP